MSTHVRALFVASVLAAQIAAPVLAENVNAYPAKNSQFNNMVVYSLHRASVDTSNFGAMSQPQIVELHSILEKQDTTTTHKKMEADLILGN